MMARVECPVLLVHGRKDRLVRVHTAIDAVERNPEWRLRILEDVGHVAQLEAPKQWLHEVNDWLDTEPRLAELRAAAS
jgi:pimeloyl-ACP methyl ester carboxylesterase